MKMNPMIKQSIYVLSQDNALTQVYSFALQPYFSILPCTGPEYLLLSIDDHIRNSVIDCLAIDMNYFESASLELTIGISEFSMRIPVAVLCTTHDYESLLRLVNLGYYQFVDDPLSVSSLVNGIKTVIAEHGTIIKKAHTITISSVQYQRFCHDLLNIITAVSGYIELLLMKVKNTEFTTYCEKTELTIQKLILFIRKGFIHSGPELDNDH